MGPSLPPLVPLPQPLRVLLLPHLVLIFRWLLLVVLGRLIIQVLVVIMTSVLPAVLRYTTMLRALLVVLQQATPLLLVLIWGQVVVVLLRPAAAVLLRPAAAVLGYAGQQRAAAQRQQHQAPHNCPTTAVHHCLLPRCCCQSGSCCCNGCTVAYSAPAGINAVIIQGQTASHAYLRLTTMTVQPPDAACVPCIPVPCQVSHKAVHGIPTMATPCMAPSLQWFSVVFYTHAASKAYVVGCGTYTAAPLLADDDQ